MSMYMSMMSVCLDVGVRQLRSDVLFDRRRIGAPHLLLQLAPCFGDLDELAALVDLAFAADHQPLLDQSVDQAGGRILRDQHLLFELDRSHHPFRRARQFEQRVVPGERREAGLLQFMFDRIEHTAAHPHQTGPGGRGFGRWFTFHRLDLFGHHTLALDANASNLTAPCDCI